MRTPCRCRPSRRSGCARCSWFNGAVTSDPTIEYQARAEARRATVAALDERDLAGSRLRLVAFAAIVAPAAFAWRGSISVVFVALPIVVFAYLIKRHERVLRARDDAARATAFYERGLARLQDRW